MSAPDTQVCPAESAAPAAGAAPIRRATARVNGVAIPEGLLVPDAWLASLFVKVKLAEVSWFAGVPVERAVDVCRRVTGREPTVRRVVDRYFDTPDRALFGRNLSVRLRHCAHPPREIAYEIIAIGWDGHGAGGRLVDGFVQTFERNTAGDIPRLLERFRLHGFEQVACFDKTRYTFEVRAAHSTDARGKQLVAPEREGVEGARGWLKVNDFGVKVDVDALHGSPFAEPSIIEVEYDATRRAEASLLADRIRAELTGRLREKEFNKIAHLLSGRM